MYTENHDIPNGIANTTLCHVVSVVLHTGVTENDFTTTNIDGYHVRTIDVTKLDFLCAWSTVPQDGLVNIRVESKIEVTLREREHVRCTA